MQIKYELISIKAVRMCCSRKIHTHPMEGHWNIPRGGGGGFLKVKILEAKYEAKPGGGGCKATNLLWEWGGGVWIFSGTAQCNFIKDDN